MRGRLKGKIFIISGGARGLGAGHARLALRYGAKVVSFDLNLRDLELLALELNSENFAFVQGDVTKKEDWQKVVMFCSSHFGPVNVLVNNAGISPLHRLETVTEAAYRRVIDINQLGTFLGMQAVIQSMKVSGGSIINIASTASHVGFTDLFSYVASKWAVRGMTKAAAIELAGKSIRVNSVSPGDTDTPLLREIVEAGTGAAPQPDELPLKRWAKQEEVSSAVMFLASDEASYITGTDILVDGAYTAI